MPVRTLPRSVGHKGWDDYADFYDWENARTFGRRDLAFWTDIARGARGPVVELGCGTGRLLCPLARVGIPVIGVDRSTRMLARARARARRIPRRRRPALILGDIRALPVRTGTAAVVLAPYGMLQSLLSGRDLDAGLAEACRVLRPGGILGIDVVPELPAWAEYGPRVRLKGGSRGGRTITLIESVRQDRRRGLTIFDERFVETLRGRSRRLQFALTFRTEPFPALVARLERAGFQIDATYGDYQRGPWHARADTWLILCRKR